VFVFGAFFCSVLLLLQLSYKITPRVRFLSVSTTNPQTATGRNTRKRMSNIALITSNPEKSKHLETATLRIDNFWVDFVNLRTESYVQDSRIPSINIGTPMEDAFRR